MDFALVGILCERSLTAVRETCRRSCRLARELALRGACAGACPPDSPPLFIVRTDPTDVVSVVALQALRNLEPGNHGWTQHTAPEGYCYYYNSHTGVSQWERPLALDFPISSHQP